MPTQLLEDHRRQVDPTRALTFDASASRSVPLLHVQGGCHSWARWRAGAWAWAPLALLGLALSACAAPKKGWTLEDQRACHIEQPARVCVVASPDRALEAKVGDLRLLPGECARAPEPDTKGRIAVELRFGDGKRESLRARVRPQGRSVVFIGPEGVDRRRARRPERCEGAANWPEITAPPKTEAETDADTDAQN